MCFLNWWYWYHLLCFVNPYYVPYCDGKVLKQTLIIRSPPLFRPHYRPLTLHPNPLHRVTIQVGNQNGNESDTNFSSLNINVFPSHLLCTPQRLSHFCAPGSEEFPRLAQVNRAFLTRPTPNGRPSVPTPRPSGESHPQDSCKWHHSRH